MKKSIKRTKRERRHARVRARIFGVESRPRLSVYRSNRHIYAQIVDDDKKLTLVSASDDTTNEERDSKKGASQKTTKRERARSVGTRLAESAKQKKITKVVFDRGGFLYAGRVKELAEAARHGGLEF